VGGPPSSSGTREEETCSSNLLIRPEEGEKKKPTLLGTFLPFSSFTSYYERSAWMGGKNKKPTHDGVEETYTGKKGNGRTPPHPFCLPGVFQARGENPEKASFLFTEAEGKTEKERKGEGGTHVRRTTFLSRRKKEIKNDGGRRRGGRGGEKESRAGQQVLLPLLPRPKRGSVLCEKRGGRGEGGEEGGDALHLDARLFFVYLSQVVRREKN